MNAEQMRIKRAARTPEQVGEDRRKAREYQRDRRESEPGYRERCREAAKAKYYDRTEEQKEDFRAYHREWSRKNPSTGDRRISKQLRNRLLAALRSKGLRKRAENSAVRDLGCSIPDFRAHIESQFTPGMSWDRRTEWHFDHIRPLSSFNLSDPSQVRIACHFTNIQPLWATDNLKKGAKI